jgi:hypothetical protein
MNRSVTRSIALLALVIAVVTFDARWHLHVHAQASVDRTPTASLVPAPTLTFGASADSNSPGIWSLVDGQLRLFVMTSFNGWPTRHMGAQLSALANRGAIAFEQPPAHGVWMEAVIADEEGTWYGYYHNEVPAEVCDDDRRMLPRIGAARSRDFGATWEDLGIILEAPRGWHDCATTNRYFVGGVGDLSAVLDHDGSDVYFFFSQYGDRDLAQGVAVGRMAWADRDRPTGRITVWWRGATWVPPRRVRGESDSPEYVYAAGVPIYRAQDSWHDGTTVDAFWGPSVHWNTHLERWVMLLNRARDIEWRQEGIYVAYAKSLDDPSGWSAPQRLIAGGMWYPQVVGIETAVGTDKVAGERARFFMSGRSQYVIQFAR